MSKNYYKILGVDKNVGEDELKSKYKKLCLKFHPDRHAKDSEEDKKKAEESFKEVCEAYEVLSDPQKRQQYDMFGTVDGNFSSRGDGMTAEDIMREFMGGGFGHFGGFGSRGFTNSATYRRGSDKKIRISVTLEDVYFERIKNVTYDVDRSCDICRGNGSADGSSSRCPHCGGTGMVTETQRWAGGIAQSTHPCPHCGGTGYAITNPCPHCGGTGVVTKKVSKGFKIPKIDRLNYTYKFESEGNACHNNAGTNGDLLFTFVLNEDPNSKFYVDEANIANIYTDIEVSVIDCLVGCEKEIKSVDGRTLKIKIPQGTKDGYSFAFNGYGFKTSNGIVGKLIAKVKMIMPKLTDKQISKIKEIINEK